MGFIKQLAVTFFVFCGVLSLQAQEKSSPNIILLLADDLGWGDVGFNGNEIIKTPQLDKMAASGVVYKRFYAASPLCSPTRGSCLTGRYPFRYGILSAHTHGLRPAEITVAEVAKERNYTTGLFGKWHLGWLEPDNVKGRGIYSPPWHHGFDSSFCTYSAVPTYDPQITPDGWNKWGNKEGERWSESYFINGREVTEKLQGDDSKIIMDKAIPFIENAVKREQPFFACIWFHTPHEPVVAGPEYRAMYRQYSDSAQHYFGCITAMDDQIGRLNSKLEQLGVADNTIILFTSDNGPEGEVSQPVNKIASTGPFRGHKHTIYEGGLRVPAVLYWPGNIDPGRVSDAITGTVDFFPTVAQLFNYEFSDENTRIIDGESL
jgi:arylsulfatase A-like enzyme